MSWSWALPFDVGVIHLCLAKFRSLFPNTHAGMQTWLRWNPPPTSHLHFHVHSHWTSCCTWHSLTVPLFPVVILVLLTVCDSACPVFIWTDYSLSRYTYLLVINLSILVWNCICYSCSQEKSVNSNYLLTCSHYRWVVFLPQHLAFVMWKKTVFSCLMLIFHLWYWWTSRDLPFCCILKYWAGYAQVLYEISSDFILPLDTWHEQW